MRHIAFNMKTVTDAFVQYAMAWLTPKKHALRHMFYRADYYMFKLGLMSTLHWTVHIGLPSHEQLTTTSHLAALATLI